MLEQQGGPANYQPLSQPAPEKAATKSLHHQIKYEFDRNLRPGQLVKVKDGPPAVFRFNPRTKTSRSSYTRERVVKFLATGYSAKEPGLSDRVSTGRVSGLKARYGVVAVDPSVIPYGTAMFVEGYGYGVAADCGGAIKGRHIDLCFNTVGECNRWGRRQVIVHLFKEREFEWRHVQHRKSGKKKSHRVRKH